MKKYWRRTVLLMFVAAMATNAMAQELDKKADERMRRVVKVLRTTNKAQVNQFVPVAFEMKNVNPYSVMAFVRRTVEAEEGNWWTFAHPDGDKGRIMAMVPVWQVEPLKELIALIDRPGLTTATGTKYSYYHLKHRSPLDSDFLDAVGANLTGGAVMYADPPTGAVFLEDSPSGISTTEEIIQAELDVPTAQVLLRAKVYEVELNNDGTLGLDYHAWKNGPGRSLFAAGAFFEEAELSRQGFNGGVNGLGTPAYDTGVNLYGLPGRRFNTDGYNIAYYYDFSSAFFDFLVSKGRAKVLTQPRVTVLDGETGEFSTGEQILYYQVQNGASPVAGAREPGVPLDPNGDSSLYPDNRTVTGALVDRTIGVADAGVDVEVSPTIAENAILLDLEITLASQLGYDDTGAPKLSSRGVITSINAVPGKEYLIGGMTRNRTIQTTRKIPFLGSIPVIGWLFGGEITTTQKTMVVIAITAEAVDNYSGLNAEENATINNVESEGMDSIPMPKTPLGYDMWLMDGLSE